MKVIQAFNRNFTSGNHVILFKLHWLPISYRVVFKLLLLIFKTLKNGHGLRYLVELLQHHKHSRTIRSNSQDLLWQQKSNTKSYHDRAFSTCAPRLWTVFFKTFINQTVFVHLKMISRPTFFRKIITGSLTFSPIKRPLM